MNAELTVHSNLRRSGTRAGPEVILNASPEVHGPLGFHLCSSLPPL